jgi:DNA-directed RNA polymerase specialized sigma24 family protein
MPFDPEEFTTLMDRLCAGDEDAARLLVERYGDSILRVIRRRLPQWLRSKYDSQDFTQAVWASFFALPHDHDALKDPARLAKFLRQLASHKVIDVVRQRGKTAQYNVNRERSLEGSVTPKEGELPARQPTPSQTAMAREEVGRALDPRRDPRAELPPGRTAEEIARELKVSLRTVYRVLARLKKAKGLS